MSELTTFFGLTLDPLHIGAGGYRLGRVDLTIIRDPGTNLPKAPGSSIAGVCRNYTIYGLKGDERNEAMACAGHGNPKVRGNCGRCIVCRTYGYALGESAGQEEAQAKRPTNQMGLVRFHDASIAAFPVATMHGPVWVTTASILAGLGATDPPEPRETELMTAFQAPGGRLNLGWLLLSAKHQAELPQPPRWGDIPELDPIRNRLVIAPESLFPEIVNANLEVRTSVSIDFETGAAKQGALFTYEAMPRATLLTFDVVVDTYRCQEGQAEAVWDLVRDGLTRFEILGLGGMNTRGFGRMKVVNL